MHDQIRQAISLLKGSWRYRWLAAASAWLVCLSGWLIVFLLPNSFKSEASVYVDSSSALRPLLEQLTVGNNVLGRVEMVTAAMVGRPQLEKVAEETGLTARIDSDSGMDRLIETMRSRIQLVNNAARDPNLFEISYVDEDPQMAQSVVATLVNIFVEDSLNANRVDTQYAQEFLRQELQALEEDLVASELRLSEFKRANVGRMPGEGGDYFERLQTEMQKLEDTQSSLRLALRSRDALRNQLAGESPILDSTGGPRSDLDERIADNESRLDELKLRFTDQHPDVIATQATLDQLRRQQQEYMQQVTGSDGAGVASDNPVFQNIQIELTNVNVEIAALIEEEALQQRRIRDLQELIDVLPEVEAELSRLTRDYDVTQAQYESLLQRLEMAELSASAELNEDVKFRIIDPPFLPDKPDQPKRPLLLAAVLIAGLAIGGLVAFVGNQLKPVFHDVQNLRTEIGLPVIGSVNVVRSEDRHRKRVGQLVTFGGAIGALCVVFVVLVVLHVPGSEMIHSLVKQGT